jgi:hypothetical protein
VRQGQPAVAERPLEHRAVDAGLGPHRQRRLVDLENPVEALEIDDDAVVDRQRPALRAGSAAPRQHGYPGVVRHRQDAGDLLRGAGIDDDVGARCRHAPIEAHLRQPRGVDRVDEPVDVARGEVGLADDAGERGKQIRRHLRPDR